MYIMKKYPVSVVRERLSEALDAAARGTPVIIERRGVRYRLTVEAPKPARARRRKPRIEILDPAVAAGHWSWDWTPAGLTFRDTQPRK
jgi:antitoxin (DNA-binding transcriptional repressor) of toxin-antitoxin stability system